MTPDYTPLEAGLGFRVHLGAKGEFIGRAALERQQAAGPKRRLCTFVSEDDLPVFGGEPIWFGGRVVSPATSAGYGWTVARTIFMGYLPVELAGAEAGVEIEAFGVRYPLRCVAGPLHDPRNERLKF